jgi:hypothetical protein
MVLGFSKAHVLNRPSDEFWDNVNAEHGAAIFFDHVHHGHGQVPDSQQEFESKFMCDKHKLEYPEPEPTSITLALCARVWRSFRVEVAQHQFSKGCIYPGTSFVFKCSNA